MRIRNLKVEEKPLLMIIPMIDIIFFLLVFFMMSMLTMVSQKTIALSLPKTSVAEVDTTKTVPVSVTEVGHIYIEDRLVSLAELAAQLQDLKTKDEKLTIVLRGDEGARYGNIVEVFDAIRSAGIYRV